LIVRTHLLAFHLDPVTLRSDATGIETRDRARAHAAQAGEAEVGRWEIDGRFHRRSSWSFYIYDVNGSLVRASRARGSSIRR
jgi:hypothetical protein